MTHVQRFPGRWVGWMLGLVLIATPALAKPSLSEQIAQERRELAALQKELEQIKRKRDLVSVRERSVAERLDDTERELAIKRRLLKVAALSLAQKDQEMTTAAEVLAGLEADADEARRRARARVRELAKQDAAGYGRFLLADPDGAARRYHVVRLVVEQDRRVLMDARSATIAVTNHVTALATLRRELETHRQEKHEAFNAVLRERKTRQRLLRSLQAEKIAYNRSIQDLEEASRRLEALIGDLVRKSRQRGTGFAQLRGQLPWPASGDVVAAFGRHKHPRFDTYIDRKGIELRAAADESIRAVADGQIVYADRFKGYGMVVIIDHGERYLSLYGNAAALRVHPGDTVAAGQVIGTTRADSEGDRLYFELRRGEDPLDPLGWLKKRGGHE